MTSKKGGKGGSKDKAPADPMNDVLKTLKAMEKSLAKIEKSVGKLDASVKEHGKDIRAAKKDLERIKKKETVILDTLGLPENPRKNSKSVIDQISDSTLHLQEYQLTTNKRIENILGALKNYRQLLSKVTKRVYKLDTLDKIRSDIEVKTNTLYILAMNGIEVDKKVREDLKHLKEMVEKGEDELSRIKEEKKRLDSTFEEEMKRYDLETLYSKKRHLPGYG